MIKKKYNQTISNGGIKGKMQQKEKLNPKNQHLGACLESAPKCVWHQHQTKEKHILNS